ncbi:glycosyltransferase family 2 protein [Microbacterium sp.]|uniref:glycosyltransferase family 2 protein n=1 Tax=Microbacterium sp. TaxID=51671 RepID=UPI003C72C828
MSHRVGIVVRTKQRPRFLARALADIANQTYTDAEVLVVNDGGPRPEVEEVVAATAIAGRISVLDTTAPGGRCAAANAGIRASTAEFVVLHDDDDLWHPEFLARAVALLDADPDDAGVMVPTEIVYEEPHGDGWRETGRVPFWAGLSAVSFTSLLEVNRAVPISFLYRRAVHEEVGYYDESLEAVEDWEFYLRLAARYPLGFLPGQALAFWTQRPGVRGADANSMFQLAAEHERDDAVVRDRALREWVALNGPGLPLYIAQVEKRLREDFARELGAQLERQREAIMREIYDRHPIWRRLRRLRRRPDGSHAPGHS